MIDREPPLCAVVERALRALGVGPGDPVVVACSGGPDSAVLADLAMMLAARGRLGPVTLVHIDHQLRPDSAEDGAVVRRLAAAGGAAVRQVAVEVDRQVASLEQAARHARYAALDREAQACGARWVLLGHTASDQAETVLMRILRGTGVPGLAGIPERRGRYVRPLLAVTRAEVEAHAAARGLETATDPSNQDQRFLRNRVRWRWLPALRRENPALDRSLCRLAAAAAAEREVLDWAAERLLQEAGGGALALDVLERAPAAVRRQALARACERAGGGPLGASHLASLDRLITGREGSACLDLPGIVAVREYERLHFGASGEPPAAPAIAVRGPDGPYTVRPWRPGDRMRPMRLRGRSRKLSDLYVDAKIPRRWRSAARVVIRDRDGVIEWAEHLGPAWAATADVTLTTVDPVASNKG